MYRLYMYDVQNKILMFLYPIQIRRAKRIVRHLFVTAELIKFYISLIHCRVRKVSKETFLKRLIC